MPYKYCQHIKENGTYCGSAALRGRGYCYFHARVRARRLAMAQAKAQNQSWNFQAPTLEDMPSVQSALAQVMEALASGQLDPRRARLMLDALRLASANLRSIHAWIAPSRFEISEEAHRRAHSYAALEAEFGLPKRIDIDTPPEVAFPPPAAEPAAPEEAPERVATAEAKKPVAASAAQRPKPVAAKAAATGKVSSAKEPNADEAAAGAKRPPASVKPGRSPGLRAAQAADA